MPRDESDGAAPLHVDGLYEQVRSRELKGAFAPDPRLLLGDLSPGERAALESQRYAPTALGQVNELLARQPVKLPRWLLGGRITCPEARGWAAYESRDHDWSILSPDDTLVPADGLIE
jgi:hypothetical protein